MIRKILIYLIQHDPLLKNAYIDYDRYTNKELFQLLIL